jgi:acetyl-CoA carboxylase biotin carboxyl carrier protein
MKRSDLTEFAVEEEGFKLKIRRENGDSEITRGQSSTLPVSSSDAVGKSPGAHVANSGPSSMSAGDADEETDITFIKSPMVGTFYRAASPDSKAFSDVGTKVIENTPVCIIEAMKIMNEIQAETMGTIVEILVENGQPVEYGQRLFKVKQG